MDIFLQFDLPSILLGSLAALACGLLGNFLVLRKQALMGDAISHVVLPGIVIGFLFTHETSSWAMMLGAGGAAIFAVLLIELIRRIGNVEPGAAMGVVFTTMFAAGVVILEQTGTLAFIWMWSTRSTAIWKVRSGWMPIRSQTCGTGRCS